MDRLWYFMCGKLPLGSVVLAGTIKEHKDVYIFTLLRIFSLIIFA